MNKKLDNIMKYGLYIILLFNAVLAAITKQYFSIVWIAMTASYVNLYYQYRELNDLTFDALVKSVATSVKLALEVKELKEAEQARRDEILNRQ